MPYCVADNCSSGISSGRPSTIITPRIAVKEIEDAISSLLAPMIGATAAIAELPQMELPQAIRIESRVRQPQHVTEAEGDAERDHDDRGDRCQQRHAGSRDGGETDRGPQQHDRDFEQLFGAEGDTGLPARRRFPEAAQRHPEQDRHHQRFDIGVLEDTQLGPFEQSRDTGHGDAQKDLRISAAIRLTTVVGLASAGLDA